MGAGRFERWMALVGATAGEREFANGVEETDGPEALVALLESPPPQDLVELHRGHPERVSMTWEPRVGMLNAGCPKADEARHPGQQGDTERVEPRAYGNGQAFLGEGACRGSG